MTITIDQLVSTYRTRNPQSLELFTRAQASLPGGNTRTGVYVDPFPVYSLSGAGACVTDVDGNERLDFVNNATALIIGHAHPSIVAALQDRAALGTAFFGPTELEIELAELLRSRLPSLERLRFCSSGTEAVLNAIRVARAFTGKPKIAKFEGAYHGIDDPAMISYMPALGPDLGPEDDPRSVLSSGGLAPGTAESVVVLPFNDPVACEAILRAHSGELAAVIVDPLSTAAGLAFPQPGFLESLREITTSLGQLLIFDEIVSFRLGFGGTQGAYGIDPDLTCLAKVIAGGTPGGAFGGREDVMSIYDPTGGSPGIPQSGTYNGNPLVAIAGLATLKQMTAEAYAAMNHLAQNLGTELEESFRSADVEANVVVAGSMFRIYFLDRAPQNYRQAALDSGEKHRWLNFWMMNHGITTRLGGCLSLPMTQDHTLRLVDQTRCALKEWPF
ncbi:MAG: aminotransferase class III-fold pyridoxal phosphate-dependent enzyme [Candidatus Latescibacterota bacterium]|nr:aspartate aminotransferase family protein [Gemmatimonadaceae bacterium]MEC8991841.1 aminotransferase class III-fold pyridoxal phosphate-dependent enzyme [Candidatus Latescibacterota bacterium]MEE3039517.1 aminotransferase class III-fold pyridoxal phosphate-dependent enzyme [Candidatus Latescibacterota bacterium]MEE3262815.1 aminotransferase class III-fold pyridoxal phosphate-dependent enzyme [Candidatus Latescibacterota bacterium]MEE3335550.1 aminotransferase class III-fold pyridoxal phospha